MNIKEAISDSVYHRECDKVYFRIFDVSQKMGTKRWESIVMAEKIGAVHSNIAKDGKLISVWCVSEESLR